MAGRKVNSQMYKDLNFTLIKSEKKYFALCGVCNTELTNIAVARLKTHRNRCYLGKNDDKPELRFSEEKAESESCKLNRSRSICSSSTDQDIDVDDSSFYDPNSISEFNMNEYNLSNPESEVVAEFLFDKDTGMQMECKNFTPGIMADSDMDRNCQSSTLTCETSSSASTKNNFDQNKLNRGKPKKNQKLTGFIDKITPNEINNINKAMARCFFGCNIPLSVADSDHFRNFVTSLRPAYSSKIPSRKVLSTTLLDAAYKECIADAKQNLNEFSVLLIDGWKNTSNNSKLVVTMLHNAKGNNSFLDAWDFTTESETGENLAEVVNKSQDLSKQMYNTTVYAVVSDKAAAMRKMGKNIDIWHSTCSSHTGNLLAKDVLDEVCKEKVVTILKEFKHPDLEKRLVDAGGSRIKSPVDTRWCTYRDSYKCLINNLKFMKNIIINTPDVKKIKQDVKKFIFDDEFIEEVRDNISLYDPICSLINRAQSTDCSIAEAAHMWLNLKLPEKFQLYEDKLENRKAMALNIYALTSFFLHPAYNKNQDILCPKQQEDIQDFLLENLEASGIEDLHVFSSKEGVFKILFNKNILDPIVFWNTSKIKHRNLSELALKLLQIPASSAQIERVFSNWSYVHSPLRNRLTFDRSKQLLHVYYSLKFKDQNKSDEY